MIDTIIIKVAENMVSWAVKKLDDEEAVQHVMDVLGYDFFMVQKWRDNDPIESEVDEVMTGAADMLGIDLQRYADPVDRVLDLPDDMSTTYLWVFEDDATDAQVNDIMGRVRESFVKANKRDPNALHIGCTEVDEIKGMDPEQVRDTIGLWLAENDALPDRQA